MREARTLKDALHRTTHEHPTKSVAAIAEEIGMKPGYLYRATLPEEEEGGSDSGCSFPLKRYIALLRATGDLQSLDYIERMVGRVGVPVAIPDCKPKDLPASVAKALSEFGEVMKEYAATIADGRITPGEAERFGKECFEAMQELAGLNTLVRKLAGLK